MRSKFVYNYSKNLNKLEKQRTPLILRIIKLYQMFFPSEIQSMHSPSIQNCSVIVISHQEFRKPEMILKELTTKTFNQK